MGIQDRRRGGLEEMVVKGTLTNNQLSICVEV